MKFIRSGGRLCQYCGEPWRWLKHKLIQLFKMTHQISPPYLRFILPAAVENRYNTRNSTSTSLPVQYTRLSSTQNSFVPSSIKAWKNLPVGIRSATSFYIFLKLHWKYEQKSWHMFHPNMYCFYISRASVHHCRLRLGLSTWNSQRFQYGFISSMSCDSCNNNREDFFCPAFAAQRQALIEGLTTLLPTAVMQKLLNILLYSSDNFTEDTNFNIFSLLQAYIRSSKRFST